MAELSNLHIAVIATDGVEESELSEPVRALKEAGARVDVLAPKEGQIQAMHHHDKASQVTVDRDLRSANPGDYDALMLPGGALNADSLRMSQEARSFVQEMQKSGKPIAAICHAPWVLVSAGVVQGRTLTSYYTIQDDVRNAGGNWVDQEVVEDRNWVTSRQPKDIPAFNKAMIRLFSHVTR